MLQIIGLMIGFYIVTRMLDTCTTNDGRVFIKIVSVLTLLLTVILMILLIATGSASPNLFNKPYP